MSVTVAVRVRPRLPREDGRLLATRVLDGTTVLLMPHGARSAFDPAETPRSARMGTPRPGASAAGRQSPRPGSPRGPVTPVQPQSARAHQQRTFAFDFAFDSADPASPTYVSQQILWDRLGSRLLDNVMEGYNGCLFAYGQTGSGKSYSMFGPAYEDGLFPNGLKSPPMGPNRNLSVLSDSATTTEEDLYLTTPPSSSSAAPQRVPPVAASAVTDGIIPRLGRGLFRRIEERAAQSSGTSDTTVEVSFYQIYMDKVYCLLTPQPPGQPPKNLRVREHPVLGPLVLELEPLLVRDANTLGHVIRAGTKNRSVAATRMNQHSSRSHAVLSLNLQQRWTEPGGRIVSRSSRVNLVDLAGSEKTRKSGSVADGGRLNEAVTINQSLAVLGQVIMALADISSGRKKADAHVPYRDSVLTWLLKENLGGNSRTIMLSTVSPVESDYEETLQTLRYASQAKRIQCKAVVNEAFDQDQDWQAVLFSLQKEVTDLRERLRLAESGGDLSARERQLKEDELLLRQLRRRASQDVDTKLERTDEVLRLADAVSAAPEPDQQAQARIQELEAALDKAIQRGASAERDAGRLAEECSALRVELSAQGSQTASVARVNTFDTGPGGSGPAESLRMEQSTLTQPAVPRVMVESFATRSSGSQQQGPPDRLATSTGETLMDNVSMLNSMYFPRMPQSPQSPAEPGQEPPTGSGVLKLFSAPCSPGVASPLSGSPPRFQRRQRQRQTTAGSGSTRARPSPAQEQAALDAAADRLRQAHAARVAEQQRELQREQCVSGLQSARRRVDGLHARVQRLKEERLRQRDATEQRLRAAVRSRSATHSRPSSPPPRDFLARSAEYPPPGPTSPAVRVAAAVASATRRARSVELPSGCFQAPPQRPLSVPQLPREQLPARGLPQEAPAQRAAEGGSSSSSPQTSSLSPSSSGPPSVPAAALHPPAPRRVAAAPRERRALTVSSTAAADIRRALVQMAPPGIPQRALSVSPIYSSPSEGSNSPTRTMTVPMRCSARALPG
eukprot:TRINITY_DN3568_c0_g1_i1.p1 TRINITY_DN3568_c0_g1~~TRINITY_DN3568_c0_g1_i1.p1  ORF type:complete len:1015 (+),score=211.76 TRINITY_DN3568_c0_g1_i1:76-3120(+)